MKLPTSNLCGNSSPIQKTFRRWSQHTSVMISTFLLDIALIFVFISFCGMPDIIALTLASLISLSINFFISYHWIFHGTKRSRCIGYFYFLLIDAIGIVAIVYGTLYIQNLLDLNILISRAMIAVFAGLFSFFANNYLNFQMHTTDD